MWCMTKLGYSYTAEIPVFVDVDGNKFKVTCVAEGVGYNLFAHRTYRKSRVVLKFSDVDTTPSMVNPGKYVVSPNSLQTAISRRVNDVKINVVRDIPEITFNGVR